MKDRLRILATNDDGIDAPGLSVLVEAARTLSANVELWVVAPQSEQSGASQSATFNTPLRIRRYEDKRFALSGTPSDCVALALQHLMKDAPPDFILSGVNAGINVGLDVFLSGTLGAAFTGLMFGIPSVGVSAARAPQGEPQWENISQTLVNILPPLLQKGWEKEHLLSINIPNLPPEKITGCTWTRPANGAKPPFVFKQGSDLRNNPYFWLYTRHQEPVDEGTDVAVLQRGEVSVSLLSLTRAHKIPALSPLSLP